MASRENPAHSKLLWSQSTADGAALASRHTGCGPRFSLTCDSATCSCILTLRSRTAAPLAGLLRSSHALSSPTACSALHPSSPWLTDVVKVCVGRVARGFLQVSSLAKCAWIVCVANQVILEIPMFSRATCIRDCDDLIYGRVIAVPSAFDDVPVLQLSCRFFQQHAMETGDFRNRTR
jgi:hypothetical protein